MAKLTIPVALDPDARLLTDEEISAALGGLEEKSPAWRALMQLLTTRFAHAVGASTAAKLTEREAGIAAGHIEALLLLREELKTRRASVRKPLPRG